MKIVQINATCGSGSTGKICLAVSKLLSAEGIENYILYTQGTSDDPLAIRYAGKCYTKLQALLSRILGNYGFNSRIATLRLLRQLKRIGPDIVHIHNIHSHDCHLGMLLRFLKKASIRVVWTFHDCWAFTGLCTQFDFAGCTRWKTGCGNCPQRVQRSWFFDRSATLWRRKRQLLTALDLTVVTPSKWLANMVKQSFLQDKPVYVMGHGIDLTVFRPTSSDFAARHGCGDKHIILGVAFHWDDRKGLDVFVELARRLGPEYQIVLVGTDASVAARLPANILSIHRTQNQQELAQIYSSADVLVNPTREDTYPTVNMEALACGTPVLTFATGGSPEMLDATCACVVDRDDLDALTQQIHRICQDKPYSQAACLRHSEDFDEDARFAQYLQLYRGLL